MQVYNKFLHQSEHSVTADFSHSLRIQLIPQASGLGLTAGSGYDYVNGSKVPEPTTFALMGMGFAGV